jgi:hypothetical protein
MLIKSKNIKRLVPIRLNKRHKETISKLAYFIK